MFYLSANFTLTEPDERGFRDISGENTYKEVQNLAQILILWLSVDIHGVLDICLRWSMAEGGR
jgi:hypothetical protein